MKRLECRRILADIPPRQPNHEIGYERPLAWQSATISVELYDTVMPPIIPAQASNCLSVDVTAKPVDWPAANGTDSVVMESKWRVIVGAFTYEGRIYVPVVDSSGRTVISRFHDNPEFCHFGALNTTQPGSRDFHCPGMDLHVRQYVCGCKVCHGIKVPPQASHGISVPLGHHHSHAKSSWWTSSLTCQTQQDRATPGYSLSLTTWQRWQSSHRAEKILNCRKWPGSSLNSSIACASSWAALLHFAAPSLQAESGPGYDLTWVKTIDSKQCSIHRWIRSPSIKTRQWSSITRCTATISTTIWWNSCH